LQKVPRVGLAPAALGLVDRDEELVPVGPEELDELLVLRGRRPRLEEKEDLVGLLERVEGLLDDELVVGLEVEKITRSQIFFRQQIRRANPAAQGGWDELIAGRIQIVCVNAAQMKIVSIPSLLRTQLEALQ
jgi:hypothetical protein